MTMTVPQPSGNLTSQGQNLSIPSPSIPEVAALSPKDAQYLATWAKENYLKLKNNRTQFERQWYLNLAFYYGKQNVLAQNVRGVGTRLITPPAPPWRVRTVINRIRPIIRSELSKLTSQKPSASVIPASSEDADLLAAQAGEQIWESMYAGKDIKTILSRALWWTCVTGTGYVKTFWDPSKLDPISGQFGDICYMPETPFHVLVPDLREVELENQPFLIHSSTRSPEWVKMNYKSTLDGKEVRPNTRSNNEILDDAFLNLIGANQDDPNSVLIHEVFIKPGVHPKFPNGAMFTTTEDQVLQFFNEYPYKHNEFCMAKFDHIPTGKFYSDSVIVDLLPVQREYNRTRSQIIEAKNKMSKPQLSAPAGSIDASKMTTEPGQIIFYKPGFQPPQPIPLQGLPSYVQQEVQQLQQDMDDISGQHEVSRGTVPTGVTAATAISYLQEQDDTKLSHTIDSVESGMEKIARHTLSYVAQYWDIPRLVKITGTDGSFDSAMFKGSQLNNNTDIRIEAGSALPTSKAARQALIMDFMKLGFIKPEEGMQILEMGGITKLYESVKIDQAQARRENLKMQNMEPQLIIQHLQEAMNPVDPTTGQPMPPEVNPRSGQPKLPDPAIPVNTWDNHAIHIDTHNRFRKSQAFENLDPANQMLFEIHVQKHMEAIAGVHIGGMPTPEMMISIAEQQANQPPPTDMNTPMDPMGNNPDNMAQDPNAPQGQPGPDAMAPTSDQQAGVPPY
jgi:hypothetical protein